MEDQFHDGLVVFSNCEKVGDFRVYVVDLRTLKDTGMPLVRRVDECAFHAPVDHPRNKEEGFLKREERRYNRPLGFGDIIIWSQNRDLFDMQRETVIGKFIKISNKNLIHFPSRSKNEDDQILIDGVINPNDPSHLYTEYFPSILIPTEKQNCAAPNVYFKVWITLKLSINTGRLLVKFDSIQGVSDHDIQSDVRKAPWNKGNDMYLTVNDFEDYSEEEEDYGGFKQKSKKEKKHELMIYDFEAIRTGDLSVLLWKLPQYKAVLPFRDPILAMKPGECYKVDAIWNSYENVYMINCVRVSNSSTTIPAVPSGLLRVSVKENETIRGLFENEMLGPVDDPKGILALLHLSPLAKNAIPLVVSDGYPSRGGQFRFQVADIHGDKKNKLAKWMDTTEIKVDNESGVVLDDGRVFSAKHSPIFFNFSTVDDPPPIGTFVRFSAIYDKQTEKFRISEWRRDASKEPLKWVNCQMDPKHPEKKQPVFFVSGTVPSTHKKIKEMIVTSEFGLIDDNLKLLQFNLKNAAKQFSVWVTFARYSTKDPFFSRTVFHVVGARAEAPEERVKVAPPPSKEEQRFQETFSKILEESNKAFEEEEKQIADETSLASERFSFVSASSAPASSATPVPETSSAASTPTSLPKGFFSARARFIRSESSATVRPESSASQIRASPNPSVLRGNSPYSENASGVGDNEDARKFMETREQKKPEPYTGPVLMPKGSKMKFNVHETLKRIRFSFNHHRNCGFHCDVDCPWQGAIALLIVDAKGFWDECMKHYPDIAAGLTQSFVDTSKGAVF